MVYNLLGFFNSARLDFYLPELLKEFNLLKRKVISSEATLLLFVGRYLLERLLFRVSC
jgi:hypothetical protein